MWLFKQNYTQKLFKYHIRAVLAWGKSRISRFPPKKFYNIDYSSKLNIYQGPLSFLSSTKELHA